MHRFIGAWQMNISNNIIKYYLRKVYFITGTAYAGKSENAKKRKDSLCFDAGKLPGQIPDIAATAPPIFQIDLILSSGICPLDLSNVFMHFGA